MGRIILSSLLVMLMACSDTTADGSGVLIAHSFYSITGGGDRTSLSVMERPNAYCLWVDLAVDAPGQWKKHALPLERHDRLVALVDDLGLVDRYRVDAQPPGSVRECIQGTSVCYEPGIVLSTGPLSILGDAAYVLHIPPETDAVWTEETSRMAEEYGMALDECINLGIPIDMPGHNN